MKLSSKIQTLTDLIQPAVDACGVQLWGIEFRPQGKRSLLCVYIDVPAGTPMQNGKPASVGVDDCKRVSHQVSGLMDVHDPISGEYTLEVSSPGWDRQFFNAQQLQGYIGQTIAIRLIHALDNRRKFVATLVSADDEKLEVNIELSPGNISKEITTIPVSNIDKANLEYRDM